MGTSKQILKDYGYTVTPPTREHKKDRKRYLPMKNCRFYRGNRCTGLDNLYCTIEKCSFYKPREDEDGK